MGIDGATGMDHGVRDRDGDGDGEGLIMEIEIEMEMGMGRRVRPKKSQHYPIITVNSVYCLGS